MMTTTKFLDELTLQQVAPSVFAYKPSEQLSESYKIIPTIEVVRGLRDVGYFPVKATQSNCRAPDGKNYSRHMVRLRQEKNLQVGDLIPEIVLINSHDGTTTYQLRAGIYRLVCSNGLVVGNDSFCARIRHSGDVVGKMQEAAHTLLSCYPQTIEIAQNWQKIPLTLEHKAAYAEAAAALKWDQDDLKINPASLLRPRRFGDGNSDLWTTFNVVQENMIKGGQKYYHNGRRGSTRGVNSVAEDTRLNTALWKLTEALASKVA